MSLGVNLLPPEILARRRAHWRRTLAMAAALAGVLALLAAGGLSLWSTAHDLHEAAVLRRELAHLTPRLAWARRLAAELAARRARAAAGLLPTRVGVAAEAALAAIPAGVEVRGLAVDGTTLTLSGEARDLGRLAQYLEALRATTAVAGITLTQATAVAGGYQFTLSGTLEGAAR